MNSPRRRTALDGVYEQDNVCFFQEVQEAEGAARQQQEFASAVAARLEAADDLEPHIVVGGKGTATADHQHAIG
jgi:hypothetical protein